MGQLADRLNDLARIPSRVSAKVAPKIAELIQEEFDDGADPYGTPWEPLAEATLAKGRTPPPLTDTLHSPPNMRDTVHVRPMQAAGVKITIDHPAAPHQTGWNGRQGQGPARPPLPARGELPAGWQEVIESEIERDVRRVRRGE